VLNKEQQQTAWVAAILVLGTVLLYAPVAGFAFINFDDGLYLFQNPQLKDGFSWRAFAWCFQAGYASNWHPLTWLSHLLDCQLFGLKPGPPHVVNAVLHAANAVILFVTLKRMTQAPWRSAMVAALFAWHPLRVESVAWVAERKDVLSAFFWMLSLYAYVLYVEESRVRGPRRNGFYTLALVLFACGLMSKPMVITLPAALLLLDWWPLGRWGKDQPIPFYWLLWEKLPFFLLAGGSCVMTLIAQDRGGAVATLNIVPWAARVGNAVVSYPAYLGKLFWPEHLSVIYSLVFQLPWLEIALAAGFVVGVTIAAGVFRLSRPYWLTGWLWFLGTLLPVIGLVQVGGQSMADRYTYIPSIGILIIVCWGMDDLTRPWPGRTPYLTALAAVLLTACAWQTNAQVKYWRNSGMLFQHSLALDPDNYLARCSYACYLRDQGELEPARLECQRAIRTAPSYVFGYSYLSGILQMEGKKDEALSVLRESLKIRPDFSQARCDLAQLLLEKSLIAEAESELQAGLKFDPDDAGLHLFLGYALARQSKFEPAEAQFAQAARLDPENPASHFQWALVLAAQRKTAAAVDQYRAALRLQPDFANALNNLAWLLAGSPDAGLRDGPEAVRLAARACALTQTNDAAKIQTLANACATAGHFDEAIAWAQKATEVALAHGQTNLAEQTSELQKLYHARRPYYDYP